MERARVFLGVCALVAATAAGVAAEQAAVIIGIDDYVAVEKLGIARAAAKALAETLREKANYAPARLVVMTDDATDSRLRPVHVNVRRVIEQAAATARVEDTLLVFFCGHALISEGVGYLVPADGDALYALGIDWLKETLERSPATRKVLVLDTHHAGSKQGGIGGVVRGCFGRSEELITILSTTDDQFSHPAEDGTRSLFASLLIEGLSGDADADGDRVVTVSELGDYLNRRMVSWSAKARKVQLPLILGGGPELQRIELTSGTPPAPQPTREEVKKKAEALYQRGSWTVAEAYRTRDPKREERLLKEAEDLFKQAIDLDRSSPAAHGGMGRVLYRRKEYAEALEWLNEAVRLHEHDVFALQFRGLVHYELGETELALRDLASAIEAHPDCNKCIYTSSSYRQRCLTLWKMGRFEEAVEDAGMTIKYAPPGSASRLAEGYDDRGKLYVELKRYDLALEDFARVIETDPQYEPVYWGRARARRGLHDDAGALEDYDRAIRWDPGNASFYWERADVRRNLGQLDLALADCDKAIEMVPSEPKAYNVRGMVHGARNELQAALEDVRKAVELKPDRALYHANCAFILIRMGRFDEALGVAEKARTLDPGSAFALYVYGHVLRDGSRYREALQELNRSIELNPADGDAYCVRSSVFVGLGDYDAALADAGKALELLPGSATAHYQLGDTLRLKRRFREALEPYNRAIEIEPNYPRALYMRGETYELLGQSDLALKDFTASIDLCRKEPVPPAFFFQVTNARGYYHAQREQFELALADFRESARLNPRFAIAHSNCAYALTGLGRWEAAIEAADRAISLSPDYPHAHSHRGYALVHQKKYDEALRSLTRAVELLPGYAKAYSHRAQAHLGKGEFDKAWADVKRSRELGYEPPAEFLTRLKESSGRTE